MTISQDLRKLRYAGAVVLVVLAVLVLAARIVGLVVVLLVEGVERSERLLAERLDVVPLGGSMVILPTGSDGVR